jgi:hypothetical protein
MGRWTLGAFHQGHLFLAESGNALLNLLTKDRQV